MKEAGFTDIRTSINIRQNTVAQYIATRPLMDLCERTTHIGGARVTMRWWDQKGIDWGKSKSRGVDTESESELETDMEEEEARNSDSGASGSSGEEWSGSSVDQWEVNSK